MELEQIIKSSEALPSIPRVIAMVMHELGKADPDLRKISTQLKEDPVMTARLLAIANSARFSISRGVSSVAEALPLLGLTELRDMVYAAAVTSSFRQVGGVNMQQFWRYSLNTAKLARKLSLMTPHASAAFTAGLVHATGELVLHRALPEQMATLEGSIFDLDRAQREQKALGYSYTQVGGMFARAWRLPAQIEDVLEWHAAPLSSSRREPLTAVVHIAAWRARAQELGLSFGQQLANYPQEVATFLKLEREQILGDKVIDWASSQEVSNYL